MLNEFYAVTETSIYHVEAKGLWVASSIKIALGRPSKIPLGTEMCNGGMIAIRKTLLSFIPEPHGPTSPVSGYERNPNLVNTRYWRKSSSLIVALFKRREDAQACFEKMDKVPCDPRWEESTREIIEEIGDEHPSFFLDRSKQCGLLFAVSG